MAGASRKGFDRILPFAGISACFAGILVYSSTHCICREGEPMALFMRPFRGRKLTLLPLVMATYFMVSGGPYGIEDILGGAGFAGGLLILILLPLVWSLPTALMIGELASAIPADGGFYVWVR